MGLFQGLIGNASAMDASKATKEYGRLLAPGEEIEAAYQLIRNTFMFTSRRLIVVDKQGMTGRKTEYTSIPYRSITRFSVETAGMFDLDAELKIWVAGDPTPIGVTFNKKLSIYAVQSVLASYVLR